MHLFVIPSIINDYVNSKAEIERALKIQPFSVVIYVFGCDSGRLREAVCIY